MRKMRTPYDFLLYRFRLDPAAIALRRPSGQISFAELLLRVKRVARILRSAGVRPGQVVVTAIADKSLDWIVTLAIFHEAAVSCSYGRYKPWTAPFGYDWIVVDDSGASSPPGGNVIVIERRMPLSEEMPRLPRRHYASEDAVARISLTSGTSGRARGVPSTLAQLAQRTETALATPGAIGALCMLGSNTAADFRSSLMSVFAGTPLLVATTKKEVVQSLREGGVRSLTGSPTMVAQLLDELEASGTQVPALEWMRLAGAATPKPLLARIQRLIAPHVVNLYGATETGGVCSCRLTAATDASAAGYVAPHAQVEVVDDDGRVLAPGEEGTVRTKTPYMASGYVEDPQASASAFREGWFYPGDRGVLRADGLLVLAGRDTEVLNLGGVKFDPVQMEQFLLEAGDVRDAAVFAVTAASGVQLAVLSLVAAGELDARAIRERVSGKFQLNPAQLAIWRIEEILRNGMGKVMRNEMRERYVAAMRRQ